MYTPLNHPNIIPFLVLPRNSKIVCINDCFFFYLLNDFSPSNHRTMDKQKNTLLEAYAKSGIAKCKLAILEQGHSDEVKTTLSSNLIEQIDSNLVEIQKFVDINDSKVCIYVYMYKRYSQVNDFRPGSTIFDLARFFEPSIWSFSQVFVEIIWWKIEQGCPGGIIFNCQGEGVETSFWANWTTNCFRKSWRI